ncbi:MAG: carbohydrate ABC transporter permease [Anaerolineae bacterium]|nr:carbohydrate ABC transporter permease [Anaerolineae bacterium]
MNQITATPLPSHARRPRRKSWAYVRRYIALIIVSLIWLAPVAWLFLTSLKPENQITVAPPRWFPHPLSTMTLQNYEELLFRLAGGYNVPRAFFNSMLVSILGTFLVIVIDVLAGYALARMRFPGRGLIFAVIVSSMILPAEVLLIPNYITVWKLGWLDDLKALIAVPAAAGFGVFLMRQFFMGIPTDLEDAAQIDGASRLDILWYIVLPLSRGIIATLAVLTFLLYWNDFVWPYIVVNQASQMTVPVVLYAISGSLFNRYGALMSAAALAALPAIILFMFAQRLIIRSITLTGIKG